MEKVKKERLTQENIIKDLLYSEAQRRYLAKNRHSTYIIPILYVAVIVLLLTKFFWIGIIIALGTIYPTVRCVMIYRDSANRKRSILNGEFTVITDKLVNIGYETVYEPDFTGDFPFMMTFTRDYEFFYFDAQKWQVVGNSRHYDWSKEHYMSTQGLRNTSILGDEFYLVINNYDHEIGYIYNTKFFEYK